MSARDQILADIRAALSDASPSGSGSPSGSVSHPGAEPEIVPSASVAPRPAARRHTVGDVVGLFAERVADYRATVTRCAPADLTRTVVAALVPGASVIVPADLPIPIPDGLVDDGARTAADLDRIDAVVTEARVAIAETGTLVLDHGPGQGRRALTLVPDRHVCVVRADQIVADVPDALAVLAPSVRAGRPLTWISGPSATSDIELRRVEGVHGPRTLIVIIVT
ncbi:LutC/YkgG family protein [Candidatus Frankia nodulisporulans]|uniref:LutC/YkgG family protein n=1 Tax=Candidatus Frankia nodulisporulans TaxID=2060052 RepID=UPI0013D39D42|nr:LUD domain-containing protein [Candidatus Frankia nodulisporulans]